MWTLGLRRAGQWLMLAAMLLVAAMPNGSALCLPWIGPMHLHVGLAMHADAPQQAYTVYLHRFGQADDHAHPGHDHGAEPMQIAPVYEGPAFMPGSQPVAATMPAPAIPWAGALSVIAMSTRLWTRIDERSLHPRCMAWPPPTQPPRWLVA